ncbi:MAG: hypothetical protein IJ933_00375 [Bacteroidales bacterium]|nr:hypothetical protein [Bacteroidales bacterium]
MENNEKKGCAIVLMVLSLAFCVGVFIFGWWLKGMGKETAGQDELQERMFNLPVLSSDAEISAAVNSGDPKDYLIKDYVFQKAHLVKDTVLDLLVGSYVCIDIVKERQSSLKEREANTNFDTLALPIAEEPYCQIIGDLYLNDGTPLQKPDSLVFLFSYMKKMYRIWESEINPRKTEFFINSRYYPNRGDYSFCFNVTYMAQDEKATFAARLGNGRATLGVFPGKNIVLVGGDRISMDDSGALASIVWTVMGYFFMAMGVMFVISILLKKKNLFSLRQNEGA